MEVERPKGYPEGPETQRGRFANDRIAGPGIGKWKSPRHLISFLLGLVVMRLALSYDAPLHHPGHTLAFLKHLPKSVRSPPWRQRWGQ